LSGWIFMDYSQKWKVFGNVGEGGQGKVYRVGREQECSAIQLAVREALIRIVSAVVKLPQKNYDELWEWLPKMLHLANPMNQFALKVLHELRDAKDPKLAKERIQREIGAMAKNLHPNLIKLGVCPSN